MEFEEFEPIFGEPKVEWEAQGSCPKRRFLFRVHAPDSSHLRFHVTDFRYSAWEATRSVIQLEDMRDSIGIGDSWSEFVGYIVTSMKSDDLKLVLAGNSNSKAAASAKLVAQKSKGMPLITIPLTQLPDSAASEAMADFSLRIFEAFKNVQCLLLQEKECSFQLTKVMSAEKGKNETIRRQLEKHTKRQKLQNINELEKSNVSADKLAPRVTGSMKVTNQVVPAHRRAAARGALLRDSDGDDK